MVHAEDLNKLVNDVEPESISVVLLPNGECGSTYDYIFKMSKQYNNIELKTMDELKKKKPSTSLIFAFEGDNCTYGFFSGSNCSYNYNFTKEGTAYKLQVINEKIWRNRVSLDKTVYLFDSKASCQNFTKEAQNYKNLLQETDNLIVEMCKKLGIELWRKSYVYQYAEFQNYWTRQKLLESNYNHAKLDYNILIDTNNGLRTLNNLIDTQNINSTGALQLYKDRAMAVDNQKNNLLSLEDKLRNLRHTLYGMKPSEDKKNILRKIEVTEYRIYLENHPEKKRNMSLEDLVTLDEIENGKNINTLAKEQALQDLKNK